MTSLTCYVAEEWCGEVALAKAAHDGDDAFALEFGACGDLRGGPHVGSTADTGHDAFFFGQSSAPFKGHFVIDLNHIIDDRRIQVAWHEASTDTLNAMLARLSAADHWRMLGLDSDGFEVRIELFDVARNAGDRAPVPTPATMTSISCPVSSQISGPVVAS